MKTRSSTIIHDIHVAQLVLVQLWLNDVFFLFLFVASHKFSDSQCISKNGKLALALALNPNPEYESEFLFHPLLIKSLTSPL